MIAPETIPPRQPLWKRATRSSGGSGESRVAGWLGGHPLALLAAGLVVGVALGWWVKRR